MPSNISMRQLLETGVHFGHRSRKWNPKMSPYIFTERNGVHIIDLQQTLEYLNDIYDMVRDDAARGGILLFVGTKRQAQEAIALEAERSGSPYVNQRWLGGTLTNWKTIKQRIDALKRLESDRDEGHFDLLTKKERLMKQREIDRLQVRLGGVRDMPRLPTLLFVVDMVREHTAVAEANSLKIPIISLLDTNGNPDKIDHLIPGNDDAIRSISLITKAMADAVIEGTALRKAYSDDDGDMDFGAAMGASAYDDEGDDEAYLGQSTLAKLREGDLSFDDDNDFDDDDE